MSNSMSTPNWEAGFLGDLCSLKTETVKAAEASCSHYVGLEHLQSGKFFLSQSADPKDFKSTAHKFQTGDILYGKLRPYLDKAVYAPFSGVCSTELLVLRTKNKTDAAFLLSVIHSKQFIDYAQSSADKQYPRTSWTWISKFPISIPSSKELKKIAAILWKIQQAIEVETDLIRVSRELKAAVVNKLFTEGLRGEKQKETEIGVIPESWETVNIGSLFNVNQGVSINKNISQSKSDIAFLRTSNVYWGNIDLSSLSRISIETSKITGRLLARGDLLVCEGGDIGRSAVWKAELDNCTFQNHIHRLRAKSSGTVEPEFIMTWLEVAFCQRKVYEGVGNKTTIPNLSRTRLENLLIPLPSFEEQKEISAVLQRITSLVEIRSRTLIHLKELFHATLSNLISAKIRVNDLDIETSCLDKPGESVV